MNDEMKLCVFPFQNTWYIVVDASASLNVHLCWVGRLLVGGGIYSADTLTTTNILLVSETELVE